jgi:UDPglucose 6-dehydrogenase
MKLSIIGLGRLGAPMAAVLADSGHHVVGVDVKPEAVRAFNEGKPPVSEPHLADYIARNRARLSATMSIEEAVEATDITFIIVPTPSNEDGTFSLRYVLQAGEPIGRAIRRKTAFHLVVLSSTVMPGSTGGFLLPALEKHSGKRCGRDFGLCYNPEFIALGSVIHDMVHPDLVLIGESDQRSGDLLADLHSTICQNSPEIRRMNYVNAEITKLSVNTFVTTKISYANMLAEVCEALDGADVSVVTAALGADTRIGKKYLMGALGYGGPCFPRDNQAFAALGRQQGVPTWLADSTDEINRRQTERLAGRLLAGLPEGSAIGILGLAYKPDTCVVEQSQGLLLALRLAEMGVQVVVYDPEAMVNAEPVLGQQVTYASSMEECARQVQVLAVTTPWKQFEALRPQHFNSSNGRVTVMDCWRILPRELFESETNYLVIGAAEKNRPGRVLVEVAALASTTEP